MVTTKFQSLFTMSQSDVDYGRIISGILVSVVLYRSCVVIYRLFLSPLAKFPGPKLAAATSLYEAFFDLYQSNFPDVLAKLHDEYGKHTNVLVCQSSVTLIMALEVPLFASIPRSFRYTSYWSPFF